MAQVTVTFMNNTDSELVGLKTPSSVGSASGTLVDSTSIIKPVILVETDAATMAASNYFSIGGDFTRYYYLEDKVSVTDSLWRITGRADLRSTYFTALQSCYGVVERNRDNYNMYLPDPSIPVDARKIMTLKTWGNTLFSSKATGTGNKKKSLTMLVLGGD